jgi:hypothetical protein
MFLTAVSHVLSASVLLLTESLQLIVSGGKHLSSMSRFIYNFLDIFSWTRLENLSDTVRTNLAFSQTGLPASDLSYKETQDAMFYARNVIMLLCSETFKVALYDAQG